MNEEKINGNSAVLFQVIMALFLIPFCLFVGYIILAKSFNTVGICILLGLVIITVIILRGLFYYGDVYLSGDKVTIWKLTGSKTRNISEVKNIGKAFAPSVYYIEFIDGKKIFFMIGLGDFLKQIFKTDFSVVQELKSKFHVSQ